MSSEPTNQRGPLQALGLGFHVEAGWVFAALPVETLSAGLETNIDETRSAVTAIPPSAISTEPEWVKLARELAYEAQVYNKKKAEELWDILDIIRPSALPLGDRAARNGCQCIGCGNPSRQRRCTPASEPSQPRSSLRLTRREQTEED